MFTGIIEELGRVQNVRKGSNSARIHIRAPHVVMDVKLGDSIAVNGICLTVVEFDQQHFTAEVMAETLNKTNLGELTGGDQVNLERAVRLSDRLGGHLVSGHVDGVGQIVKKTALDIAIVIEVSYPAELAKYLIPKGSIAIDGISLTLVEIHEETFTVSVIPHTRGETTLGFKKTGDLVNLEADVIAKYLERLSKPSSSEPGAGRRELSMAFLAEHGFS